jgi:tetratricopeptide (TPR) repeat protein
MEEVIRAGRGTPYPDLFRYLYVVAWVNAERSDAAEKWLQVHEREFDNPFRRAYSWLFLVMPYLCDGTVTQNSDRVLHLARAAMEAGPGVSSSGEALVLMARIHKAKGRVAEAVACLEKAVSIPDDACGPFEDESARYARSDAGNLLASLYLEQKEWSKSLACWKAWNPYPMCANELWDQDLEVSLGVGRCLEELDRLREAADHYWSSVLNIRYSDSPAQRLVAVHRSLGTLEELKDKVRVKAYASDEFIPEGVKSLADDLGVTPK